MRDINIKRNNNGSIIDNSISIKGDVVDNTIIVNSSSDVCNDEPIRPEIYVKETSIKNLLFGRYKEMLWAVISGIIVLASYWVLNYYELQQTYKIIAVLLLISASACTLGLVITALEGILNIFELKKKGVIRYLKSPFDLIVKILSFIMDVIATFFSSENESLGNSDLDSNNYYLSPKGVYQNFDGKIYELRFAKCPYCELEPIGKMRFMIKVKNSTYVLRCNQQKKHKIPYDYKKKYNNMKIIS